MKWIIALMGILLLVSPVFAANIVLNPSFELTQSDSSNGRNNPDNLTIPLDWFLYDYNPDGADQAAWSPSLSFVNTTAGYSGSNSLEIVNDVSSVAVTQTIPNVTNGFYLEFYINILNGTTTSWFFGIGAAAPDSKEIHINTTGDITECLGYNFTCNSVAVGGGWYKINATLTTALTGSALSTTTGLPFIFLGTDGVGSIGDSILLDNVILNPTPQPVLPITGQVTGATSVAVNAVIVIFALIVALIGFLMLGAGAKGADTKLIVTGFVIMFMGVVFAITMFGAVN